MANNIHLVLTTQKNNIVGFVAQQGGPSSWFYRKLSTLFQQLGLGAFSSNMKIVPNLVAASGTITFTSIADADTVTVNNRIYTAKTSGASGAQQFNIGGSDTVAATNFQAKVNADTSTNILDVVVASSASAGVTTITAAYPGNIGNGLTIAISAHGSVSGSGRISGGTQGTVANYVHGL